MDAGDFWNNQEKAQATVEELKALRLVVPPLKEALASANDLTGLLEMLDEDDSLREEVVAELQRLESVVGELELVLNSVAIGIAFFFYRPEEDDSQATA